MRTAVPSCYQNKAAERTHSASTKVQQSTTSIMTSARLGCMLGGSRPRSGADTQPATASARINPGMPTSTRLANIAMKRSGQVSEPMADPSSAYRSQPPRAEAAANSTLTRAYRVDNVGILSGSFSAPERMRATTALDLASVSDFPGFTHTRNRSCAAMTWPYPAHPHRCQLGSRLAPSTKASAAAALDGPAMNSTERSARVCLSSRPLRTRVVSGVSASLP
jgi:hypothetical protein